MAFQQVHTTFTFGVDKTKMGAIDRTVKNATANMKSVTAKSDEFQRKMSGFWGRAKGVVGAYLGFRALRSITKDYAQSADTIAKFAAGLGISAQQYQRMTHAAQLNGITIEELQMAIPKLAKSAGDAADGTKSMALAFRRANTDIRDASGKIKDPITLMTDLAEGLKSVEDRGRKTQILMNIFGRAGKKMGVLMDQGADGIRKAMAEADKLGIVLSQKQLKAAENYNDEMLRVKSIMIGIRNTIAGEVLPVITRQLRAFQQWWREGKNAERAMKALKGIAFFTSIVLAKLITAAMIKKLQAFTVGLISMARAMKGAAAAANLAAIKIALIAGAIVLVALIIQDLVYFAQGKDSLIGRILGDTETAANLKKELLAFGRAVAASWREMKPALLDAWLALKPAIADLWGAIKPLIGPAFKAAIGALIFTMNAWKGAIWLVTTAIKTLTAVFNFARNAATAFANALGISKGTTAFKTAISGLYGPLSLFIAALQKADDLRTKLFGQDIATLKLGERTAAIRQRITGTTAFDPTAAPLPAAGPFLPPSIGLGLLAAPTGQRINTTVAAGAVNLTVNASGDPETIGRVIDGRLRRGIQQTFTEAARDMKKPPAGQQ